ncbi:MAG: trypsin-like peptidase domain-containing protein [Actinomycetota bacterium]
MRNIRFLAPLLVVATLAACTAQSPDERVQTRDLQFPEAVSAPDAAGGDGRVVGVVRKVLPAVVNVSADTPAGKGTGTGFVVRSDGIIVTNYHVVEGAERLTVQTSDAEPESYDARVIGGDQEADLAVLDVDAEGLATVPIGDSDSLDLGQQVVAIGYALGLEGGPSVTTGIVSSLDRVVTAQDQNCPDCATPEQRTYTDVIQTDAAINPGNSGGPLVDLAGQVVGINTAGAGAAAAENIGFAIQINAVRETVQDAARDPLAPAAYLGVSSASASNPQVQFDVDPPTDTGAVILALTADGPAERAGIEVGDVVVGFDGTEVASSEQMGELIGERQPGDRVEIELIREDGSDDTVTVQLGSRPLPVQAP